MARFGFQVFISTGMICNLHGVFARNRLIDLDTIPFVVRDCKKEHAFRLALLCSFFEPLNCSSLSISAVCQ